MNLDKLFNALPRDLQWEILTEFVGTHVVRNGKLMRKLTTPPQVLKHHIIRVNPTCPWHYSKYGTISVHPVIPCFLSEAVHIIAFVQLPHAGLLMYCTNRKHSYIIFRTAIKIIEGRSTWDDERFLLDDSVVLPPFKKNTYPSYPFTNKKMGRRVLRA
jgi:hypothetical protein